MRIEKPVDPCHSYGGPGLCVDCAQGRLRPGRGYAGALGVGRLQVNGVIRTTRADL